VNKRKINIDFVIPVYNPDDNWENLLIERLNKVFSSYPQVAFNLIIVNDGSDSDLNQSKDIISSEFRNLQWITIPKNQGKGFALKRGFQVSNSELIIFTDADIPYTTRSMSLMINEGISGNSDVIVGIRGESYYDGLSPYRKFLSSSLIFLNRILLRVPITDTQGGLNLKGKECFISTKTSGFITDLEFILIASKKGLSMKTIEVETRAGLKSSQIGLKVLLVEILDLIRVFKIWR